MATNQPHHAIDGHEDVPQTDHSLADIHTASHIMSHDMSHDAIHNSIDHHQDMSVDHVMTDNIHNGHEGGSGEHVGDHMASWAAILNFGNSSSPSPCSNSNYCLAEQITVITVPILIIIGNIITISVLLKTKSFRNCHGYYLLSLATADLLMGPVALTAIFPAFNHYWPYSVTGCFLTAYTAEVCMKVSLLMLLCLSGERYIAICHPLYYKRIVTPRTTAAAIATSWVVCNLIYILTIPTELMCFTFEADKYLCTVTYFLHPEYVIGVVLAFLVPSLVIVTITNSITSYRIFQHEFRSSLAISDRGKDTCEMRVHTKKNKRVFRVLVTLLLVFYVCWIPYVTLHIYAYATGNTWELNHYLEFYTVWVAIANSCLNPMIYFGMNRTFKRATIAIVKRFISRITFGVIYGDAPTSVPDSSVMALKEHKSSSLRRSDDCSEEQSDGVINPVVEPETDIATVSLRVQ